MDKWESRASVYDPLKVGSIDGTDTEPHDNGIRRAMEALYRPNSRVVGNPRKTLFVARLNPSTNEETLQDVFCAYGSIRRCRLVRDIVTGTSKCYAFIEFEEERSVERAYREANRKCLEGNCIFVDYEVERRLKNWIPRRLGGGFGGKKESGQLRFGGRDRLFKMPIKLPAAENETRHRHRENSKPYTHSSQQHHRR
ncbi:small nuclear ribonucleoprotein 35kDa (U11 U12) [Chamberlinius hualienensis]